MSLWVLAAGLAMATPGLPSPPLPGVAPREVGTDWQSMSPLLRVHPFAIAALTPEEAPRVTGGIGRTPVEGLRFAVVVETPDTLGIVGKHSTEQWSRSEAEVYAVARAHTRVSLQTDLQQSARELPALSGGTVSAELWTGGDPVRALVDLDTFLGAAPHGALLSAPSRELVLVHRLTPTEDLQSVLATFAAFTAVGPPPGQEPFSPHLYWWQGGTLRALSVEDPDPGRPRVVPGPVLDALQQSLLPAPGP